MWCTGHLLECLVVNASVTVSTWLCVEMLLYVSHTCKVILTWLPLHQNVQILTMLPYVRQHKQQVHML